MTDQPVRIGIEIDKQAQQAVNASIDAMGARFVSIGDKLSKVSVQAQQTGVAFKQGFGSVTGEIENAGKALSKVQEGSASFYRGISGITGGSLGEIAQTSRQIEEVTRGFQKMTSQGIGPLLQAMGPTTIAGAALALGIGLVNSAVDEYNKAMTQQKEAIDKAIDLELKLAEIRRKSTTEQAETQLADLQEQHDQQKAAYDKAKQLRDQAAGVTQGKGFGELLVDRLKGVDVAGALQIQKAAQAEMDDWLKKIQETDLNINKLTRTIQDGSLAANDAADKIKKETDLRIKLGAMYNQSSDQIKSYLNGLQMELAQKQGAIPELQKLADEGNDIAQSTLDEYKKRIEQIGFEQKVVTEQILTTVVANEKQKQAAKDAAVATLKYADAMKKAEDEAFQRIQQRNKDLATAQGKYEADVEAIQSASLQKRADIEQKYADTLVSIAEDATQKAQDRLDKLNQDRAEKTLALARDEENATIQAGIAELDIRIKAQREERDALQEHLRTLENIRANAKQREQIDLLNRNFLGVLQSRLQMTGDIAGENQKYTQGQQDRTQGVQDQLSDLQRAQAQERAARLKAYQQQLADAQAAYQRETAQASKDRALAMARAQIDRNRALAEEERSRTQSLAILRKQHVQELQDIYDFGARKLKAERDLLQAALNMITQANAGSRGGVRAFDPRKAVIERADGGALDAGQWALVQEGKQREAFNGIPFPTAGAGMFYPMQGGMVSHVSNSTTNTPVQATINIPGAPNPQETARVVVDVLKKVMSR
jgi:hypothetical protein